MQKFTHPIAGRCLCGQVTFEVSGEVSFFHLCHCGRCRRATGTAHASNIFARPESIVWKSGEDLIKRFDLPEAKYFSRQFCVKCGSPLPYVNRTGKFLVIPAGTLEGDPGVVPADNIFWASRAPWYEEGLETPHFEEYPE